MTQSTVLVLVLIACAVFGCQVYREIMIMLKKDLIAKILENRRKTVVQVRDIYEKVANGLQDIKNDIVNFYQFRDRDTFEIIPLKENYAEYVFSNFVYIMITRTGFLQKFNQYVYKPLEVNMCDYIEGYLKRMTKGQLESIWNEYKIRLHMVTPKKLDEIVNEIVSKKDEFLKELSPTVVYVKNDKPSFEAVIWEFTNNWMYGSCWLDKASDRTPEDYRKTLEAKRRYTDGVAKYYEKIGHYDN